MGAIVTMEIALLFRELSMAGGRRATHAMAIFSAIYCSFRVMAAIGNSIGIVRPYKQLTKTTFMASEYLK